MEDRQRGNNRYPPTGKRRQSMYVGTAHKVRYLTSLGMYVLYIYIHTPEVQTAGVRWCSVKYDHGLEVVFVPRTIRNRHTTIYTLGLHPPLVLVQVHGRQWVGINIGIYVEARL